MSLRITCCSRKDSFVTHRAFCDALTEESYKVNQNLAAAGGMLQNQAQELFTSSMPSTDSLSICSENIDSSLRPLSLSSAGVMLTSNADSIFNTRMTRTIGGPNASLLPPGSCYTSATALLQKAAEMGAKISDNTIAPILLKGFSGYSNNSIAPSGSVNEGSAAINTNVGPIFPGSSSGLYIGAQTTVDKNLESAVIDPRQNTYHVSQTALFDQSTQFLHHPEIDNGKMTLDFLGVELARNSDSGVGRKRNYEGNVMVYTSDQQTLHNLQSDW